MDRKIYIIVPTKQHRRYLLTHNNAVRRRKQFFICDRREISEYTLQMMLDIICHSNDMCETIKYLQWLMKK